MNQAQANFRKAAVLVDSLDRRSADALLDQMDDTQARHIRQAVLELDDVSPSERDRVMAEFLAGHNPQSNGRTREVATEDDGGIEIEASLAARISEGYDEPAATASASPPPNSPFRFLQEADGGVIARFLDRENPQVVAVVLAHLPPERSADVLARLTPDRQADVVRRIARLSETPPEVLLDVEHELGSKLSEQLTSMHRQEEGLAAIRRILGAADASLRQNMLAHVAADDASLSERLATSPNDATRPAALQSESQIAARESHARHARPDSSPHFASPRAETFPRRPAPKSRPAWLTGAAPLPKRPITRGPDPVRSREEMQDQRVPAADSEAIRDDGISLERSGPAVVKYEGPPAPTRDERASAARFDDVARLTNAAIAAVFSEVDTDVAVLALTAADPKFVQRVLKQLPRRDAKSLAKQLAQPVPMRLSEIERAQQEVADIAQQLDLSGQIEWSKSTERLAAVA